MATLEQLDSSVDRDILITAFSDLALKPVHVFFDSGVEDVQNALHWAEWKRSHVNALKRGINRKNSVIYVIGRASPPGGFDFNFGLSQRRAASMVGYLQRDLGLSDVPIKVGWLGEEVFQLTFADAAQLRIDRTEFDDDKDKLNQSVHVFVYPCADKLSSR